jgi:porphobilinogen synthase
MTLRRLRANEHIRELAATARVDGRELIQPIFVDESLAERMPVQHLPGVYAETLDSVVASVEADLEAGVRKFLLFPVPATKAEHVFCFDAASNAVRALKSRFGNDMWLATDLCLCSYTTHGHCGIVNAEGTRLLNNETVQLLAHYAERLAEAGADCIAPSDMNDGRVRALRQRLDETGFDHVAILSYAAKFASKLYGPFRDVCKSAPSSALRLEGRKSYQISPDNLYDAVQSALRDLDEGADMLMVKPAGWYLDVVAHIRQHTQAPLAAYHVSGEYAALEQMAANGLLERGAAHMEFWTACKRAGANIIISYAARQAASWIA